MDDGINTQLRTITFSESRRGFDKGEVREFLDEVADWIEGGGGDVVRRRLERIAQKSANILADAEDGAEGLRREAEQEAGALLDSAKAEADAHRVDAEGEAREQLREARAEATATRDAANQYASETRTKADEYAERTRAEAEARAEEIVAEAEGRREDIETVISDLALRRDEVMSQSRKLALELDKTVSGLEAELGGRRSGAAAKKAQVEQPGKPEEVVEEVHAEPALVGNGNGSGAH